MEEMMGLKTEGTSIDELPKESLDDVLSGKTEEEEKETPAESSTANNQEQEAESPAAEQEAEEKVPFHMTEFWKRQKEKFDERLSAYEEELAALKASKEPVPQEVPQFAKDIYGDNQEGYRNIQAFRDQLLAEAEERVMNKLVAQREQEEDAKKEADAWLDSEVKVLKSQHGEFDENKLFDIVQSKNLVKIEDGKPYWNLEAGLEFLKLQSGKDERKSVARKMVADASAAPSKGTEPKKGRLTIEQMRNMGPTPDWEALGF